MSENRPAAVGSKTVPPDPSIASAVGRRHSLVTAVADLVDNSVDFAATTIRIRFVLRDSRADGLLVIDNGTGMDTARIDDAMTYARRREYAPGDLGHFGLGLKAASLSQANTLFVWSRSASTVPVGRGLERAGLDGPAGVTVLEYAREDAARRLAEVAPWLEGRTGTVVEWRDVREFLRSPDPAEHEAWVNARIDDLSVHLGLVLHRGLAAGRFRIEIDMVDEAYPDLPSAPRTVEPLDPFGRHGAGTGDEFAFVLPNGVGTARLHLWPVEPANPNWVLGGRGENATQGLYVYRNDRLLQAGGWNGLTTANRDLGYARVALELDPVTLEHVTINPEKDGVMFDTALIQAWLDGRTEDDRTFADYLDEARGRSREARSRRQRPVTLPEPLAGLRPDVIDTIEDNAELGAEGVALRWRNLPPDEVFRVDRENSTIWLNQRWREELGGVPLAVDDAQVVKVLLLLLLGDHAASQARGARQRLLEDAYQAMLLAAVRGAR